MYGEDEVVTLVLVPLPISFQITTKVNISDSKHRSAVFHVKVIVESVVVVVTSGGPGWTGGEERRVNYIKQNSVDTLHMYIISRHKVVKVKLNQHNYIPSGSTLYSTPSTTIPLFKTSLHRIALSSSPLKALMLAIIN